MATRTQAEQRIAGIPTTSGDPGAQRILDRLNRDIRAEVDRQLGRTTTKKHHAR
jgi:hypothetical protein